MRSGSTTRSPEGWRNFSWSSTKVGYYYGALLLFLLVFSIVRWIERHRFGAYLRAVREGQETAESLGVNATRVKLSAMALSAFLAALCGAFFVQYNFRVDPPMVVSLDMSMRFVLVAILGGLGTFYGPLLGPRSSSRSRSTPALRRPARGGRRPDALRDPDPGDDGQAADGHHRGCCRMCGAGRRKSPPGEGVWDGAPRGPHLTMNFVLGRRGVTSFTVEQGTIVGLIGPNGAGKTTLFNCVAGLYRPTAGSSGSTARRSWAARPHRIARLGVARTFQVVRPLKEMSVLENVQVGSYLRHRRPADSLAAAEAVPRPLLPRGRPEPAGRRSHDGWQEASRGRSRPRDRAAASSCSTSASPGSPPRRCREMA